MATVKAEGQIGMDETLIDDAGLDEALGERESAKSFRSAAHVRFKEAHDKVVGLIEGLDLPDASFPIRVGAFRIEKRFTPARSVSFETDPSSRIRITADD